MVGRLTLRRDESAESSTAQRSPRIYAGVAVITTVMSMLRFIFT